MEFTSQVSPIVTRRSLVPHSPQKPPIRVIAVDDHPLLRDGIASLFARHPDIALIAEASTGIEAINAYRLHRPDVMLMDLQVPGIDGIEATQTILAEFPAAKLLVLTTYTGEGQMRRALKAGAAGYLLKSSLRTELVETIRRVHHGEHVACANSRGSLATLTEREVQVLRRVALGSSNKEIGNELSITEEAVKARMKSLLLKLKARDRTNAVLIGIQRGILDA